MTAARYSRTSGFFYPHDPVARQSAALRARLSPHVWSSAGSGFVFWLIMRRNADVIGWPRQAGGYVHARAWWQVPDPNWWWI